MKNSKLMKELVPIAALLLFIIVVLVMCAVSARQKKGQSGTGPDTEAVQETESETESGETAESTEEAQVKREKIPAKRILWRSGDD